MKRRVLLTIIIIIELVVIASCTSRIITIIRAKNRISEFKIQRDLLHNELTTKQKNFEYVLTDTYVEKIAREKLGYAREGDVVYILPADKKRTATLPEILLSDEKRDSLRFGYVESWWRLFF